MNISKIPNESQIKINNLISESIEELLNHLDNYNYPSDIEQNGNEIKLKYVTGGVSGGSCWGDESESFSTYIDSRKIETIYNNLLLKIFSEIIWKDYVTTHLKKAREAWINDFEKRSIFEYEAIFKCLEVSKNIRDCTDEKVYEHYGNYINYSIYSCDVIEAVNKMINELNKTVDPYG